MDYIQVPNWDTFQHYGKRNPPWVKLYTKLLDNPGWHCLSGDAKGLLVGIWILAGQTNNHTQLMPGWLAARAGCPLDRLNGAISELARYEFISVLAPDASIRRYHQTETETEVEDKETETEAENTLVPPAPRKTRKRRSPNYDDYPGFSDCYGFFPHYRTRTKKQKALAVWKRDGLEEKAESVRLHIEALRADPESAKEGGRFVGAMEAWLNGRDFDESPRAPMQEVSQNLLTAARWAKGDS